jgi:hypothetical protein
MTMKPNAPRLVLGIVLAATISPLSAADAVKPPSADAILRKMSSTLANANQFTFKGTREIGVPTAAGRNTQRKSDIVVTVRRPDRVAGTSTNGDDVRGLYFDGRTLTMVDGKNNLYSTVSLPGSLDALPAQLSAKYGFLPPLAEFVMSSPYTDLKRRSKSITYVGRETAGALAVATHHLKLAGKLADAELWIGVDDHLPRKMTTTAINGADKGTVLTIEFIDWNLDAHIADQAFTFVPPAGALQIPMIATAVGVRPASYFAALPAATVAYTTVVYKGQTCQFAGGVHYCPAIYQGQTIWVRTP